MKLIPFILFFITNSILAQEYIPLLKIENKWSVITVDEAFYPGHTSDTWFTSKLTIRDSILDEGIVYHEIINEDDSLIYLIHENVEEKKIYFGEELVYNFSLNIGDTIDY